MRSIAPDSWERAIRRHATALSSRVNIKKYSRKERWAKTEFLTRERDGSGERITSRNKYDEARKNIIIIVLKNEMKEKVKSFVFLFFFFLVLNVLAQCSVSVYKFQFATSYSWLHNGSGRARQSRWTFQKSLRRSTGLTCVVVFATPPGPLPLSSLSSPHPDRNLSVVSFFHDHRVF